MVATPENLFPVELEGLEQNLDEIGRIEEMVIFLPEIALISRCNPGNNDRLLRFSGFGDDVLELHI